MKRPNGYGSIIYLGKKRRRPWAVRLTDMSASINEAENGQRKRKYKYIGYYETKNEAYAALEKFNRDDNRPCINYIGITFKEIWDIWSERNLSSGSQSRIDSYKTAFNKCESIHKRPISTLRLADLQCVIDTYSDQSKSSLNNIKIVMNFIYEWAQKNDVIQKNYAQFVGIPNKKTVNHKPFAHAQVDELITCPTPDRIQKMILIYLFTGCRVSELLNTQKSDVHIDEQYIHIRKAKTSSGVRLVPIADRILPIVKEFYDSNDKTLFGNIPVSKFRKEFCYRYPNYTPHDTRSTFISFMVEKDVPLITIQKIVGHKSGNVTSDVYTKLSLKPLLDAVNKL